MIFIMKNVICLSHSTPLPSLPPLSTKDCKAQMTNNCERLTLLRIWQLTGASKKSNLNHRQYKPESKDTMSWHNSWCASHTAGSFSSYLFQQDDSLDSFYSNTINSFHLGCGKCVLRQSEQQGRAHTFLGNRGSQEQKGHSPRPHLLYATPASRVTHYFIL